ncbi:TonB family protein [Chitinimonas lacunae]|uniref:Protein TonB n=1 Tax=Chitinimonas lacunae TaxID=1963018 RepID=A0ABV8MRU4_9NEIS
MGTPNLLAVYARTAAGDEELKAAQHGLSLNQRKLLQWADGDLPVMALAERLAAGHTIDTDRVARDIERLEVLGLLAPLGAGLSEAPLQLGQHRRRGFPLWVVGASVAALAGVAVFAARGTEPAPPATGVVQATATVASAEPEQDSKLFGVVPNPSRWFTPTEKPAATPEVRLEPKPVEKTAEKPKPAAPVSAKPVVAVAPAPVAVQPVVQPASGPTANPAPVLAAPVVQPVASVEKPVQLASAQPMVARTPEVSLPPPKQPNLKPVFRQQPDFPREAAREGVTSGNIKARMTVDENGAVVQVDILEARPRRVFDRAVIAALSKWKFEPSSTRFVVDTEVEFRDN